MIRIVTISIFTGSFIIERLVISITFLSLLFLLINYLVKRLVVIHYTNHRTSESELSKPIGPETRLCYSEYHSNIPVYSLTPSTPPKFSVSSNLSASPKFSKTPNTKSQIFSPTPSIKSPNSTSSPKFCESPNLSALRQLSPSLSPSYQLSFSGTKKPDSDPFHDSDNESQDKLNNFLDPINFYKNLNSSSQYLRRDSFTQ